LPVSALYRGFFALLSSSGQFMVSQAPVAQMGTCCRGGGQVWRRPNCADPNMTAKSLEVTFQNIVYNQSINDNSKKTQDLAAHWWQTIVSAYSEPQRHYHTVDHIASMWKALEMIPEDQVSDRDAVVLAILFHECATPSILAQW
jgi:predicted metal-dependent HD superfamily phosphohydrolase